MTQKDLTMPRRLNFHLNQSDLSSSWFPSIPQEEARLYLAERARDDAAGGAPGDPQHCQRLWMQQWTQVPGPHLLFWHPHHLRGSLHQPGSPALCYDHHKLVLRASTEAKPQEQSQKHRPPSHWEYRRHKQASQRWVGGQSSYRQAVWILMTWPTADTITKRCFRPLIDIRPQVLFVLYMLSPQMHCFCKHEVEIIRCIFKM